MTNRERVERRIGKLIQSNPGFTERLDALLAERALDESKHMGTRDLSYRDRSLSRMDKRHPHMAQDREEKRTKEALAAAIGAVHLAGGMSQRLLGTLAQAERYLRKADALPAEKSYERGLLMAKYASALAMARMALRDGWKKSYRMGVQSSGMSARVSRRMSPGELGWVRRAANTEMKFFDNMIADIKAGKAVPTLRTRINMYGKALLAAFTAGQVASTAPGTLIHWLLDPEASHCEDCLFLSSSGPYLKDTLPTTPRAGLCKCRCITSPEAEVLTRRGLVPIALVEVGDLVWTHRSRWREVLATPSRTVEVKTAGALVRGVGFTADHKFWTTDGWQELARVATDHLQMIHLQYAKTLREVFGPYALGSPYEYLPTVRELLSGVWCGEGSQSLGVPVLRDASEGIGAVAAAGVTGSYSSGPAVGWCSTPHSVGESHGVEFYQHEEGRQALGVLLGRREEEDCVPVPLAVGSGEWGDSRWDGSSPQEREPQRRSFEELEADDEVRSCVFARPGESGGNTSSARHFTSSYSFLSSVRTGVPPEDETALFQEVPGGQIVEADVVLGGVLEEGTVLYDLTVAEDSSFVVGGMIVSNSNCKCRLEFEKVSPEVAEVVRQNNYSKRYLLSKIKSGASVRRKG